MPPTLEELGLLRLTPQDRLAVAQALWDHIAEESADGSVTEAQWAEIERRLDDADARPEAAIPWEVVKARVLARSQP